MLVGALVLSGREARAQGVTGSAITGTVKDPSGGPAEGAAVTLKNTSTGAVLTAITDAQGRYFIDNVPPGGPFTLSVKNEGYEPVTKENIQLSLGQRRNENLEMKFAGEMVSIEAFSDALGDRARTGSATTLRESSIAKLPLQGRNFTDLVATSPQANGNSLGGQNNKLNNIQIDGGANNDLFGLAGNGTPGGQSNAKPLSIEAIKEFTITVAPFDVRQSNFVGGLVNAITKSGTNEFHGSLFLYDQNKIFARPGKNPEQGDPELLAFNVTQFGGSLGGPIIKDKLHFFAAVDIQQRQAAFGSAFQITGDDTHDRAAAGFDLATSQRFIDILKNKYGITNQGTALAPDLANPDRNVFVKLSTSVIDNSDLELSYNFVKANADVLLRAPTSTTIPGRLRDGYELSGSGYAQANSTNTLRAKMTTNINNGKMSNELLASVSIIRDERSLADRTPLLLVRACNSATAATCAAEPNGHLGASPSFLAAGAERFSQANVLDQDIWQLQDSLTFSLGDHRVTAGVATEYLKIRNVFLQAAIGVWAFNSLDDFEAGNATAFQRRFGATSDQEPGTAAFKALQPGVYIQDQWSLARGLTLSPGMRIDVPYLSKAVRNQALLTGPLPIDTSKVPSGNPLYSPRLGFNWDLDGEATTVLRGGAGIFSGRPAYVWVSNAYSVNGLSQVELTCTGATGVPKFTPDPAAQPNSCTGIAPTLTPPRGEIDYFDPNTRYPQNFKVALGVDRRLPFGIVATGDLLYTRDINGWYVTDENLVKQGTASAEGRTLYGTFGTAGALGATPQRLDLTNILQAVKVRNKNGGFTYSASAGLSKQFGTDYAISANYTYSKSQDLMSFTSSQALSNFQFAPIDGEIQNRNAAPSAFDRPHRITITGSTTLPYGFGIGLIYQGQSGTPYTWTVSGDVNADGINGNDVVFVPKDASQISLRDPTQYDAMQAFIESQDCLKDSRGSLIKRGACRNPWQNILNTRITWQSPKFAGEQRIEAQLDIFNLPNLINRHWADYQEAAQFENQAAGFLTAVGYDQVNNRPIYNFVKPSTVVSTIYSTTLSRWRMQLGARYTF